MKIRVVIFILLVQVLSRFAAAPVTGFVSDDWAHYWRSISPASYGAIVQRAVHEPSRPVQALILHGVYRLFGFHFLYYGLLSIMAYSAWLVVAMFCVYRLFGKPGPAYLFGILFSVLPNLTESFQWAALITVSYLQLAYILSFWLWLEYLRKGHLWYLVLSAIAFAVGLGSYESGVLLPVAFAVLGWGRPYFKKGWATVPYLLVITVYLVWRYTECFGMGYGVLYAPRALDISPGIVVGNAVSILDWWLGPRMLACIVNGLRVFLTMRLRWQLVLGGVNLVTALTVVRLLQAVPVERVDRKERPAWLIPGFSMLWVAVTYAPCLVSWTAGRLNFLPAFGVVVLLVWLIIRLDLRRQTVAIAMVVFAGLLVGQGTAYSWRQAGFFHQRLFECIRESHMEWVDKEVLLLETHSYRQRVTPGIMPSISKSPFVYTVYGNAAMVRGFVPHSMMQIVQHSDQPGPRAVMDVECGAAWSDGRLLWHERFNPDVAYRTAQTNVFVVDMLMAEPITSSTGLKR